MTQKERLIELLKSVPTTIGEVVNDQGKHWGAIVSNSVIADHLLNNGVIVPPCKVGDTVFFVAGYETKDCRLIHRVIELKVCDVSVSNDGEVWLDTVDITGDSANDRLLNTLDFGIDAFLTRAAAEQELKERET